MRRPGILLLLLLYPAAAFGWTRAAEERIGAKATALAPPDLRMMIQRFDDEYRMGIGQAQGSVARSSRKQLQEKIEKETRETIAMIRGRKPMEQVVERLGGLAHLVAAANDPFRGGPNDAYNSAIRRDYAGYFEREIRKFPTVFYGLKDPFQLSAYVNRTITRAASFYPLLREEYGRGERRRTSLEFDDRSTAFGVASISYSRSVSDLVNLYYFIWKEAGGDVRSASSMRKGNLLFHGTN